MARSLCAAPGHVANEPSLVFEPEILRTMFRRLLRRGGGESIEITTEGVTRALADGRVEAVRWEALTEVRIVTTSEGPLAEDVFFVLETSESGCVVPQSHASEQFVSKLQSLPGFDNAQMIEAMGAATEAEFVCWKRDR